MGKYILSKDAKTDIIAIAQYGDDNYGIEKSNLYCSQLEEHFEQLASQPHLYQAVDFIRKGYRRSVSGRHAVYYRVKKDHVEIMRIMGRQSLIGAFTDDT